MNLAPSGPLGIVRQMRFIRGIRIQDFRSLSSVDLSDLPDVVPIVGPNGSGKSNLMRALNVFFTDTIEDDDPLDLARDFREPKRKRKQEIQIELDLQYGSGLRRELREPIDRFADGAELVTIRRRWFRDPTTRTPTHELSMAAAGDPLRVVSLNDHALVYRLFTAVPFRYLPNHVHPSQVLRAEERGIRNILFERLGKTKDFSDDQIKRISEAAEHLMEPITERMLAATGQVRSVELSVPSDWRELLWAFGLQMQTGQSDSYEALMHGSGVQSVLAYSVLHLIDTSFRSSFGWRKGAIWGVEEPESFLHADLQASLARAFADFATDTAVQIFLTTHSPAFLGLSETGVAVGLGATSEVAQADRRALIRLATTSGVTPFSHPLHAGPLKPLLLVEGKDDADLFRRAYDSAEDPCPFEVVALGDIEPDLSGGVEQIVVYLKHNRSALRARPEASPVIVLLDWEVPDGKLAQVRKALSDHPTSWAERLPADARNPDLSENFVGIEGFLATPFIEHLAAEGVLPLLQPGPGSQVAWRYDIDRGDLKRAKSAIHLRLRQRANPSDLAPLTRQLTFVSRLILAQKSLM